MNLKKYQPFIDFCESNMTEAVLLGKLASSIIDNKGFDSDLPFKNSIYLKIISADIPAIFLEEEGMSFFYIINLIETELNTRPAGSDWNFFLEQNIATRNSQLVKSVGYDYYDLILIISNRFYGLNIREEVTRNGLLSKRIHKTSIFKCFPYLIGTDEDLVATIIFSTAEIKAEHNYLNLYESIRSLSYANNTFARLLIEDAKNDFRKSELFIPHAFWGLTKRDGLEQTKDIVSELIESDNLDKNKLGLWCLRMVSNIPVEALELKNNIVQLIALVESQDKKDLQSDLLYTLSYFIELIPDYIDKIERLYNQEVSENIVFALSQIAFNSVERYSNANWFLKILDVLSDLHKKPIGCFGNVDYVLNKLVKENANVVFDYLNKFIQIETFEAKNIEGFKNLFETLATEDLALLQQWLTHWLNHDNENFHVAAASVSSILWLEHVYNIQLDSQILSTKSFYDIEFITSKILGYIHLKEHLQSLIFSVTNYYGSERLKIYNLFAQTFIKHVLYNYESSIDFLIQIKPQATPDQQSLIAAIEEHNKNDKLKRRDKPKEFLHSPQRLKILFSEFADFPIEKEADKFDSPSFLDGVNKINIKIGSSFFCRAKTASETHQNFQHRSVMGHVASSYELPVSSITDPVGDRYQMFVWRNYKRRS